MPEEVAPTQETGMMRVVAVFLCVCVSCVYVCLACMCVLRVPPQLIPVVSQIFMI